MDEIKDCCSCIHECRSPFSEICVSCGFEMANYEEKKPKPRRVKKKTNADKLRTMTDQELAEELTAKGGCPHYCETPEEFDTDCVKCWLDWLKETEDENRRT